MERAVRNTENSFIGREQLKSIIKGDFEVAINANLVYLKRKTTYEFDLIVSLVEKYRESQKTDATFTVETEPFRYLESETKSFIAEFSSIKNPSPLKLREIKIKSRSFLKQFIKRLKNELNNKNVETTVQVNYNEWKSKLCECVNIWDLFLSNGLKIRFPYKYLLLKRYFINRSKGKQSRSDNKNGEELIEETFTEKLLKFISLTSKDEESINLPRGIIKEDQSFKTFLHFGMFGILIYTYLTMPVIYNMGIEIHLLLILEKIISSLFFYDLIFTLRTSFKDKTNNWVYDIDIIGNRYLFSVFVFDFLASIPFNCLFITLPNNVNRNLRFFRSLCKVVRISQIFPAITIVEKTRGFTSIVRLLKLIFTYLLIAHWIATILFSTVNNSLIFNTMEKVCYTSSNSLTKKTLKADCKWTFSIYNSSFLLIGQYTQLMRAYQNLNPTIEYFIIITSYLIGQFMVAFVFGGVASIILNLNQAQIFFSKKVEMLNEHMSFYGVCNETQNDVRTFYNYLWQRHKDIIYSKYHFDLLTESLREKFEKLNLPTNEAYLGTFYKLNLQNTKLIGQILMYLKKKILYPYEILYDEQSVTKGLYILLNGEVEFCNFKIQNMASSSNFVEYASVIKEIEKFNIDKKNNDKNLVNLWDRENLSIVFPLLSCLIKTGRNYQRCFSKYFTDLLFLPIDLFLNIVFNFPVEMHILKHNVMQFVNQKKYFDNEVLFKTITTHSSMSVGSFYEKEYNKHNLWIPIPIPISQRKIAKNYFSSFVKKVKNQYREIITSGDINITLNGFTISILLDKSKEPQAVTEKEAKKEKLVDEQGNIIEVKEEEKKNTKLDPIENIKYKTKKVVKLVEQVMRKNGDIIPKTESTQSLMNNYELI